MLRLLHYKLLSLKNRLTHAKTPTFREKTAKVLPLFPAVNIPRPLFSHSDRMLRSRITTWKIDENFTMCGQKHQKLE